MISPAAVRQRNLRDRRKRGVVLLELAISSPIPDQLVKRGVVLLELAISSPIPDQLVQCGFLSEVDKQSAVAIREAFVRFAAQALRNAVEGKSNA